MCQCIVVARLDILWSEISGDVAKFGYYMEGAGTSLRQRGIMRTNCIDCLDRTNVVQGWLARKQLEALLTLLSCLPDNQSLASAFPAVRLLISAGLQLTHESHFSFYSAVDVIHIVGSDCMFRNCFCWGML